jgi:hypothetical protein
MIKKLKYYFILIFLLIFLIEIFSYVIINKKKKKLEYNLLVYKEYNSEIIKKYSKYIPHTRTSKSIEKLINSKDFESLVNINENPDFFTAITKFQEENIENILIQGDSWAELLNFHQNLFKLKKFSKSKKIGLINAGITSFSPSAMTSQLDILKKEYKIQPSIIISIIDQTDIGDELYRYKKSDKNFFSPTLNDFNKRFQANAIKNFNRTNSNFYKLLQYAYNYYLYNIELYSFSNSEFINFVYKQIKANFYKTPKILSPLKFGISFKEKEIVKKRIHNYINFSFQNKNLKKIYFVTHPHLKHLNKEYILSVSTIINEVIEESEFKTKISHINFEKIEDSSYTRSYVLGDPFSHLTAESYYNYYLPKILENFRF